MYKKMVLVVGLLLANSAFAGVVQEGVITRLMIDKVHGNKLFIKVSGTHSEKLECHTNGTWQFVMPLSQELDKTIYVSMLLAAHASGKKIRLDGNNSCDVFGSIETLRRIETLE